MIFGSFGVWRASGTCSSGLLRPWYAGWVTARYGRLIQTSLVAKGVVLVRVRMDSRELASWKEIASALGVNIRTAQKWERERNLPVRRTPGGRVSIEQAALDAWQASLHERTPLEHCAYRWPVGNDVFAEVRFLGPCVRAEHVELLRQYLDLVKTALQHE